MKFSLTIKLIIGYALISFMIGLTGYFGVQIVGDYTDEMHEKAEVLFPNIATLSNLKFAAEGKIGTAIRIAYLEHSEMENKISSSDEMSNEKRKLFNSLNKYDQMLNQTMALLEELVQTIYLDEREYYQRLLVANQNLDSALQPMLGSNKSYLDLTKEKKLLQNIADAEEEFLSATNEWIEVELEEFRESTEKSTHTFNDYVNTLFLMSGISILIGFLAAWWSARRITRPIELISETLTGIGAGDLDAKLDISGEDELAHLGKEFNSMVTKLKESTFSKDYVNILLSSMMDGLIVLDSNLRISSANQATVMQTGFHEVDLTGQPFSMLLTAENETFQQQLSEQTAQNTTVETKLVKKNGAVIPVSISVSKIIGATSDNGLILVWRDISDQIKMIESLRKATESAEFANHSKSEFLSNMSHELRTPMNAILGFSQLLEQENLSPEQKECVDEIRKGGDHLLTLINEILDLARIESGKLTLSLEQIELADLVKQSLSLIGVTAKNSNISIECDTSLFEQIVVKADRVRLLQILLNLLSNAIKYNVPNGKVVLTVLEAEHGLIKIQVQDSGLGIPQNKQSEVFTPFNRLGIDTSVNEGTGIGLSISKKLMELMNGNIGFTSEESKGSTFWITVPSATQSEPPQLEESNEMNSESDKSVSQSKSVLYIEDNPVNMRLVQLLIANKLSGVEFHQAEEPFLGLELALKIRPSLILLDINLPGIDGYEVFKRLQNDERTSSIPVIAVSANAMQQDIQNALSKGFVDYITKPIHVKEFTEKVQKVIG